jgi:hypothetical protein
MAGKSATKPPAPAPAPDADQHPHPKVQAEADGYKTPTVFATLGHPEAHLDYADPDD